MADVDRTAVMVAACRAMEGLDPYAGWLVAAAQPDMPAPIPVTLADAGEEAGTWYELSQFVGTRTREFDGWLLAAGLPQVVLVAAGLDTRAYRLDWQPGTAVYELDRPGVLDFKSRVLGEHEALPGCERRAVRADLRDDWGAALLAAGYDPSVPTAWLVEGLMPYLPAGAEVALFDEVDRLSAAGAVIAVEYIADMTASLSGVMASTGRTTGVDVPGMVHDDQRDDRPRLRPDALLAELGWEVRSTTGAAVAAAQHRGPDLTPLLNHVVYAYGRRP